MPAHHVLERDRGDPKRVADRVEKRERHRDDGGRRRDREQRPRESAPNPPQHGRERKERDRRRPDREDRRGRRLDRTDACDAERDERRPGDRERRGADVDRPETGVCSAKLTSDETDEDRRSESGVVEMDRGEERHVLSESHDRKIRAPEDEPTAPDREIHEADRDAELFDASRGTERASQTVEPGESCEREPDERDRRGRDARWHEDREEPRGPGDRVARDQEAAGAVTGSHGTERKGNAHEDRERRDKR